MVGKATPHTVAGQFPYKVLFGRKVGIGCILTEDQQYQLTNNNKEKNLREFVEKIKKKSNEFYFGEEVLVKDRWDREYMPDTFQVINIKGWSIEAKRNSDGKFVFRDASHFKVYHIRYPPMVSVEIQNKESSSTATSQTASVSSERKRSTRRTPGKAWKRLTYDILGEPVDDNTIAMNES